MTIEWVGSKAEDTAVTAPGNIYAAYKSLDYISRGAGLVYVSVLLSYLAQHLLNLSMID
jgi:hypothetical protein